MDLIKGLGINMKFMKLRIIVLIICVIAILAASLFWVVDRINGAKEPDIVFIWGAPSSKQAVFIINKNNDIDIMVGVGVWFDSIDRELILNGSYERKTLKLSFRDARYLKKLRTKIGKSESFEDWDMQDVDRVTALINGKEYSRPLVGVPVFRHDAAADLVELADFLLEKSGIDLREYPH